SAPVAAPTVIYTLSLHDALPISHSGHYAGGADRTGANTDLDGVNACIHERLCTGASGHVSANNLYAVESRISLQLAHHLQQGGGDRKSTRLNSSHVKISYAVFCL